MFDYKISRRFYPDLWVGEEMLLSEKNDESSDGSSVRVEKKRGVSSTTKTVSWSALETWWAPDGSASQSPHVEKNSIEISNEQSRVTERKVAALYKT